MRQLILTTAVVLSALLVSPVIGSGIPTTDKAAEPEKFFREFVGLNDAQIRGIREGKAVAKILDSPTADQVFVLGAIRVPRNKKTREIAPSTIFSGFEAQSIHYRIATTSGRSPQ